MNFRASGSNLSLDYGTDPVDTRYQNHYGKYVEFSVNDYRPQIKQAIVNAVQDETARFIADLTSRAIRNAGRSKGVRFRKSA
jgi:xanthine dehydrogenase molybdopterin-binding subunit B